MSHSEPANTRKRPELQPDASEEHIFEIDRNELVLLERRHEAGFFTTEPEAGRSNNNRQKVDKASPEPEPLKTKLDSPRKLSSGSDRQRDAKNMTPTSEPHNSNNDLSFYGTNNFSQASKKDSSKNNMNHNANDLQPQRNTRDHQTRNSNIRHDTREDTNYSRREPPAHLVNKTSYDYKPNQAYPLYDQHHQSLKLEFQTPQQYQPGGNNPHEQIKHHSSHKKHKKIDYFHDDGTHDGEPDTKDHPRFKSDFFNKSHNYQPDPYLKISGSQKKIELVRPEPSRKQPDIDEQDDTMKQLEVFKQIVAENKHNSSKIDRDHQAQTKPSFNRIQHQIPVSPADNPHLPKSTVNRIEHDMDYLLHLPKEVDAANSTAFDQKKNVFYVRVDNNEAERKRLKELERKKLEIRIEKEQEELRRKHEREEFIIKQQAEEKKRLEMRIKKWEDED